MFQITSKFGVGKGSHHHIAYLPTSKEGEALRDRAVTSESGSKKKLHSHGLVYHTPSPMLDEGGQPVIDPETAQPVMDDFVPYWEVLPAEDGHTHEMAGEVPRKEKKGKDTDEEKVKRVRELFKFAKDYESGPRKKAVESAGFYDGSEQWSSEHKAELEASGRAAIKINLIEPAIDTLCGYQRQNRTDIKYLPVEEGDARVADIATAIVKNICERNDFGYVETDVFEDGLIAGRGICHAYADYDENLQGEIKIERFAWEDVFMGPHEQKDLSDLEYIHKTKWYSKSKIKQNWPDKAEDIQQDWDTVSELGTEDQPHQRHEGEQYAKSDNVLLPSADPDFLDMAKKSYRVIECEEIDHRRAPILVNAEDNFIANVEGWKSKDISSVRSSIPGFNLVYRPVNKMKITTIAGTVLLDERIREDASFSIVPFYAKKRGKSWWGKIESAKDAQREVNKRHSQSVDIVNKMAAYGWFIDPNTFSTPADEENFRRNSAKPGFVAKVRDSQKQPSKVEGSKVPTEVLTLEENAVSRMREIMGVNQELMGQGSSQQSGIAMLERKKQGLLGNEFLFDNLSYSKKQLGRRLIYLVQKVYTPERLIRVLGKQAERAPVEIGGKPLQDHNEKELIELLEKEDLLKYDVVVAESSHSPTQQMAEFVMLLEVAQTGIPIPPEMMIEASPMPQAKKEQALKSLQAQQQATAKAEKDKQETELLKSLPDEVQTPLAVQKMQGQPQGQF